MRRIFAVVCSVTLLWVLTLPFQINAGMQGDKQKAVESIKAAPATFALEDTEAKEVSDAVVALDQWIKTYAQAERDSLNAPTEPQAAMQTNCNMKVAYLQKELARVRFDELRARHQLKYNCPGCAYNDKFKALVRPQAAKAP